MQFKWILLCIAVGIAFQIISDLPGFHSILPDTGKYRMMKKAFSFLAEEYGFQIYDKQRSGSYYYIAWTNSCVNIKVLYNETDADPMRILVYDAASLGTCYDVVEYAAEFALTSGSPKTKILHAAEWLKNAIENQRIALDNPPPQR